MAFIMDPVSGVDIRADTTFALMLEAQRRGHRVLYVDPSDLAVRDGRVEAAVHPVTLRREAGNHADVGEARRVILDDEVDVAFQRVDPPVDTAYATASQILALCARCLVLNRPEGILTANEKLYTLHFPELMAPTMVARRIPQLLDFMEKQGGEMIVKPLHGKGGEGIFHVRRDDRNTLSILEQSTAFEADWIMAQAYIPEVRAGDKRILLLDGEPIGALLRIPPDHEVRSNLHVGGKPAKASLDDRDREIVATIGPWLRRDGLFFVGIDVIGGYLTEINVTSPTGIQEINALDGVCVEARVLDGVEAKLDEKST
jgi:glutathione synthase